MKNPINLDYNNGWFPKLGHPKKVFEGYVCKLKIKKCFYDELRCIEKLNNLSLMI